VVSWRKIILLDCEKVIIIINVLSFNTFKVN